MLLLGCLHIRFSYIRSTLPESKAEDVIVPADEVHRVTSSSWLEVAWLQKKCPIFGESGDELKITRRCEILRRLHNIEKKRRSELQVSFKLEGSSGEWCWLEAKVYLLTGSCHDEKGIVLLEGNADTLFFFEHVFAINDCEESNTVGDCGVVGCTACGRSVVSKEAQRNFRLEAIFESIAVNQNKVRDASIPKRPRTSKTSLLGTNVPQEVISHIFDFLHPPDLRRLSQTSRWFRHFVPRYGIDLHLYDHQERAVDCMIYRETKPVMYPLSTRRLLEWDVAANLCHVGLATGSVYTGPVPALSDFPGGLFCDEPGLGKTVTGLALIMRTLGVIPRPPEGARVFSTPDKQKWMYQIPEGLAPATGRLRPLGSPEDRRRKRRSTRSVNRPDYFNAQIGVGSVPSDRGNSISTVYLSGATLILMPTKLIHHWKMQIERHVRRNLLRLCVLDDLELQDEEMPAPMQLAYDYDIVLATLTRIRNEYDLMRDGRPLLARVRFLRVIIDEGHVLGGSLGVTNLGMVCESINTERKWIMTGTPTPNTPDSDVKRLRPLLRWLDSSKFDDDVWIKGIERPYEAFKSCALSRIQTLLNRILIRSSKKLIASIPKCVVTTILIDFSPKTSKSYNDLVTLAQRNMLLADWYSEEHQESILNSKNAKLCRELLSNLRMACCFAGLIRVAVASDALRHALDTLSKYAKMKNRTMAPDSLTGRPISDADDTFTIPWLVADGDMSEIQPALDQRRVLRLKAGGGCREYRGRLFEVGLALETGCICERCREFTRLPIVTPCAHLLCNGCILLSRFQCTAPNCGTKYVMESKKKQVPKELIELQPAYEDQPWLINWEKSDSAKLEYLVHRILDIPVRSLWNKQLQRWEEQRPKMIIFSQFKEHLWLASLKLSESAAVKEHLTEAHRGGARGGVRAIESFRTNPRKNILLMDARFAEGHDLSMVEYIFLLDPIWDQSLENQVISRAHRMGATRTIVVEKLAVRNSVEYEMTLLRERLRLQPDVAKVKKNMEATKRAALLKTLHIVSRRQDSEHPSNADVNESNDRVTDSLDSSQHVSRKDSAILKQRAAQYARIQVRAEDENEVNSIEGSEIDDEAGKEIHKRREQNVDSFIRSNDKMRFEDTKMSMCQDSKQLPTGKRRKVDTRCANEANEQDSDAPPRSRRRVQFVVLD